MTRGTRGTRGTSGTSGSGWVRWWEQVSIVLRKDVALERATGEITTTAGFFGALIAILASVAFYAGPDTTERVAPGVLWLSVAFSSVLGIGRSWYREREDGAMKGLLVSPLARSAIFAGKAIGVVAFVTLIEVLVVPVTALVFGFDLLRYGGPILVIALLANLGIAATGTLFGAMTVRTRARDLLLASVLLPLLAPILGTAIAATRELFGGAPLSELGDYLELLLVFDVVFWSAGLGMFGMLVEG